MATLLVVIGSVFIVSAVVLAFMSSRWASLSAYAGLWIFVLGKTVVISSGQLIFWGAAVAIVLLLGWLLPREVAMARKGVPYIAGASLAGVLVGMLMSSAGMIIGAALGAFCGALAYSRTPVGSVLEFPSVKFANYLGAKGLPVVVTMCIVALVIALAVSQHDIIQAINN